MKFLRSLVLMGIALVSISAGLAEEPMEMPEPTAEHKELGRWIGTWMGSGEMKEGPFGPGGPMKWTEKCSWFEGARFHVVCKSKGSSPMGPSKGLGIMGYNAEKGVYTHYGVDSSGWAGYAEGNRKGETWTFQSEETMGGATFYSRFSMTMKSAEEMTFSWQMSEDGESWMTLMDGVSKKK